MSTNSLNEIKQALKQQNYLQTPEYSADILKENHVVIYGAGSGYITLSMFVLDRFKIKTAMVLDKKFSTPVTKNGILFCSPKDCNYTSAMRKKSLVIISIGSQKISEEVKTELLAMGFERIISATDVYEYHLPNPNKQLAAQGFNFYKNSESDIIKSFELLEDERSQEVFKQYLFAHLTRNNCSIPSESPEDQYFPLDLWDISTYRRYIICGAYNGDTALKTAKFVSDIEAMVCLEPDPENFDSLTHNIKPLKSTIRELLLLPLGVYKENKQLLFAASNQSNSTISSEGNLLIQCVALDDCLPYFEPSFISMDIEGAELDAVCGMREIIKKNHPKLAICVYHSPEHIWKLPLFLHSLVPEYKFYLRNYTGFTSETVLYVK